MRRSILALASLLVFTGCASTGAIGAIGPDRSATPPATTAPGARATPTPAELDAHARALHAEAIVVDTHNDVTTPIVDEGFDLAHPNGKTHTDLPRMRAGGITAEFFAIYVDRQYAEDPNPRHGGGSARRALDMIDAVYQQIERHPADLRLATTVADIHRAKADGKIAALMGIEGGHAIEDSLGALRDFYRLGVRYMTLTHTNTNDWADSAGMSEPEPATNHGLSPFGEEVVREMQRIGMLVDVSHVSDETFASVMKVAKAPVIASHSSSRALANHRRNLTDDMLRALAKNGGVAMVNFSPGFIDQKCIDFQHAYLTSHKDELAALKKQYAATPSAFYDQLRDKLKCAPTPLSVLIDHIVHIAKVAGIDHVGLGSDFDGVPSLPAGLDGIDKLPAITRALLERGLSDEEVKKVLGENFLRVMDEAERYAASTHTTISGDGSTRRIEDRK